MPSKDIYTDPELHDQIKEDVQASDKGGAPGQWSARKAQFVAKEYKKQGGGYKDEGNPDEKKQDDQKNLENWGKEDWQTKEGDGDAKDADGNRKRYLPKDAWENMTEEEKAATEEKKLEGSKQGKQFVGNADAAKEEGKKARNKSKKDDEKSGDDSGKEPGQDDGDSDAETGDKRKRSTRSQADASKKQKSNSGKSNKQADKEEEEDNDDDDSKDKSDADDSKSDSKQDSKRSKGTHGSKHDSADEPAPKGSNDRLPKKGQKVSWKAMPGWVHGKLLEVVTEEKDMQGKHIKASKEEPRFALEADSGKFCVHKPDTCYYD